MNAPEEFNLPDIQSQPDNRDIGIDAVGIKGVRYPLQILANGRPAPATATLSMTQNRRVRSQPDPQLPRPGVAAAAQ